MHSPLLCRRDSSSSAFLLVVVDPCVIIMRADAGHMSCSTERSIVVFRLSMHMHWFTIHVTQKEGIAKEGIASALPLYVTGPSLCTMQYYSVLKHSVKFLYREIFGGHNTKVNNLVHIQWRMRVAAKLLFVKRLWIISNFSPGGYAG